MENAAGAFSKLFSKGSASHQSEGEQVADSSSAHTHDSVDKTVDSKVAPTSDNGKVDETVDTKVAPAVEHKHVKKQHETREQTFVEKERHQDIYHTTIQPLKDTEVLPEHHEHTQETKQRSINKDDGAAKAKAEADRAGLKNTSDQEQTESKTKEKTQVKEHVHYHLHETVQPVIEKEVIDHSVTHKRIDVKEKIQEPSKYEGKTTNAAISKEEFENKLNADKK